MAGGGCAGRVEALPLPHFCPEGSCLQLLDVHGWPERKGLLIWQLTQGKGEFLRFFCFRSPNPTVSTLGTLGSQHPNCVHFGNTWVPASNSPSMAFLGPQPFSNFRANLCVCALRDEARLTQ